MEKALQKMMKGYQAFRQKYALGDQSIMQFLAYQGQQPDIMVVACCDSRVDPALILQCDPGDLFVVRNVANIVPPYEKDEKHHGTSAALEFGICYLHVKHLILLGHSQCGGMQALNQSDDSNDFIHNWVSIIKNQHDHMNDSDHLARLALMQSKQNCLTFPWIANRVSEDKLRIHLWFFDIKSGQIYSFNDEKQTYLPLDDIYKKL